MISKQYSKIKSSITDTNNCLNRIFPSFNSLNSKISPESRLINTFSSHSSFHEADCHNKENKAVYCHKLNDLMLNASSDLYTIIVVSDASIRNNITMSITHIHSFFSPIKKTLHHTIGITMTEAELFVIRCEINQVVQFSDSSHIIVITDTIHVA